jgi:Tripartite tricarboxylate transporter family receptor
VPVGVGVFHLSTGFRILIRVLIGIIPAAVPRPGITVSSIEYIKAGRLRALAVTTATRSELLPDIPTVAEFVAGYEASNWFSICAPKATPAEIVEKLRSPEAVRPIEQFGIESELSWISALRALPAKRTEDWKREYRIPRRKRRYAARLLLRRTSPKALPPWARLKGRQLT